jgi:hypothetical protein
MKIELLINDKLVMASNAPTTLEWQWQDRCIQARAYLERLAKTEAIPNDYRVHILEWLKATDAGTLPPAYPGTQ